MKTMKKSKRKGLAILLVFALLFQMRGIPATAAGGIQITKQPLDIISLYGLEASFSVEAASTEPGAAVSYQWQRGMGLYPSDSPGGLPTRDELTDEQFNWISLIDANSAVYTFQVQETDMGEQGDVYRCLITDTAGNVAYSNRVKVERFSENDIHLPVVSAGAMTMPSGGKRNLNLVQVNGMGATGAVSSPGQPDDSGWHGDYVYLGILNGEYVTAPVKWRVLNAVTSAYGSENTMLLQADASFDAGLEISGTVATGQAITAADVNNWLDTKLVNRLFQTAERAAITQSTIDLDNQAQLDYLFCADLTNQMLFLPDISEVYGGNGYPSIPYQHSSRVVCKKDSPTTSPPPDSSWWLRSISIDPVMPDGAASVDYQGVIGVYPYADSLAVCPALNLDLSRILFTSDAGVKKSSDAVGTGALKKTEPSVSSEIKLTLLEEGRNFSASLLSVLPGPLKRGETVSFSFSGARTGSNEFISAVIMDEAGENIEYYGRLKDMASSTGSAVDITIPSDLATGRYRLYLFNEQCNEAYETDYSSPLVFAADILSSPVSMALKDHADIPIDASLDFVDYGNGTPLEDTIVILKEESAVQTEKFRISQVKEVDSASVAGLQVTTLDESYMSPAAALTVSADAALLPAEAATGYLYYDNLYIGDITIQKKTVTPWQIQSAVRKSMNFVTVSPDAQTAATAMKGPGIPYSTVGEWGNGEGEYVYFGNYEQTGDGAGGFRKEPIRWRILDLKNMGLSSEPGGMLLLSDQILKRISYQNVGGKNEWPDSKIAGWLQDTFLLEAFGEKERTAIVNSRGVSGGSSALLLDNAPALQNPLIGERRIFCLTADDLLNAGYGFYQNGALNNTSRKMTATEASGLASPDWWLRSKALHNDTMAGAVDPEGSIVSYGVDLEECGISPAMNLDLSRILFSSDAVGGKLSTQPGVTGLKLAQESAGGEYKLTVKDDLRNDFTIIMPELSGQLTRKAGESVKVRYANALTGENEYLSAVVTDMDGADIFYYGRLKALTGVEDAEGEAEFMIPADIASGDYKIYIFNEQCNGDKMTDYSSPLSEAISIRVFSAQETYAKAELGADKEVSIVFPEGAANTATGTDTVDLTTISSSLETTVFSAADFHIYKNNSPFAENRIAGVEILSISSGSAGNVKLTVQVQKNVTAAGGFLYYQDVPAGEIRFTLDEQAKLETPAAVIDYGNETLVSLATGAAFTVDGVSKTTGADGSLPLEEGWFGKTVSIIRKGNGSTRLDSLPQTLGIPERPGSPTLADFFVIQPDRPGKTGTIKKITSGMEYSLDNGTTWIAGSGLDVAGIPDGTAALIRYQAVENVSFRSGACEIGIESGDYAELGEDKEVSILYPEGSLETATGSDTVDVTTVNVSGDVVFQASDFQVYAGENPTPENRIDGVEAISISSGTAGNVKLTIQVRKNVTEKTGKLYYRGVLAGEIRFALEGITREETPSASIDYGKETLESLTAGMAYTVDGVSAIAESDGSLLLEEGWFGKTVSIIRKGNGSTRLDSPPQTLGIPERPGSPTLADFFIIQPDRPGKTGTIKKITSDMEYSLDNGTTWIAGSGLDVAGIPDGTAALIRYQAVENVSFRSGACEIGIEAGDYAELGEDKEVSILYPEGSLETATGSDTVDVTTVNVSGGAVFLASDFQVYAGENPTPENRIDGVEAISISSGTAGNVKLTIQVRKNVTEKTGKLYYRGVLAGEIRFALEGITREETPAASIDYGKETLESLAAGTAYEVDGVSAIAESDGSLLLEEGWFGKTVSIIRKGNGSTRLDSPPQTLGIPERPGSPTLADFFVIQPDRPGKTGTIKKITSGMEYSLDNGTTWIAGSGLDVAGIPDGTAALIRYQAVENASFRSGACEIGIQAGDYAELGEDKEVSILYPEGSLETATGSDTVDVTTVNVSGDAVFQASDFQVYAGENPTPENRIDGVEAISISSGTAGNVKLTIQVRKNVTEKTGKLYYRGVLAGEIRFALEGITREETPAASINYRKETLTSLEPGAAYTVEGVLVTAQEDGAVTIQDGWFGKQVSIVRKGNGSTALDSYPQKLNVPKRPDAPEAADFIIIQPESPGKTGTIQKITSGMEYSLDNGGAWIAGTGLDVSGITNGTTVLIRYQAVDNTSFCSGPREISIQLKFYRIHLAASPQEGGTVFVEGRKDGGAVLHAAASDGYVFKEWQKNGERLSSSPEYLLPSTDEWKKAITITAVFEKKPT